MATINDLSRQSIEEENTSTNHVTNGASNNTNNPNNEPTQNNQNSTGDEVSIVMTSDASNTEPRRRWGKAMDYARKNWLLLVNTAIGAVRCVISCVDYVQDAEGFELDITQFL